MNHCTPIIFSILSPLLDPEIVIHFLSAKIPCKCQNFIYPDVTFFREKKSKPLHFRQNSVQFDNFDIEVDDEMDDFDISAELEASMRLYGEVRVSTAFSTANLPSKVE